MSKLTRKTKETFEDIWRIDEDVKEFWTTRDLYRFWNTLNIETSCQLPEKHGQPVRKAA